MIHIADAIAEMLDLPQFQHHHRDARMTDPDPERTMRLAHHRRVLALLHEHVPTREECELTLRLIARYEREIAEMEALRALEAEEPSEYPDSANDAPAGSKVPS